MDFEKDKDHLNQVKDTLSTTFLSESRINEANEKDTIASVDVGNFYEGDDLQHCDPTANHNEAGGAPTSISSIYLFTTNSAEEGTEEFTVSDDLQFKQQMFKESDRNMGNFSGDISLPLTYYSNAATTNPALITLGNKAILTDAMQENQSGATHQVVAANQLSEEMIRSFVVGGNAMSIQTSPRSQSIETDLLPEVSLPNEDQCIVNVLANREEQDGKECAGISENVKKEIIIITNGDEETPVVDLDIQTEDDSLEAMTTMDTHAYPNNGKDVAVTIVSDKSDMSIVNGTQFKDSVYQSSEESSKSPTADELLRNHPLVCMDFNVEAEIADFNGVVLGREITTQTKPLPKPRTAKRKAKVKVILTTDDDVDNDDNFEFKRKHLVPVADLNVTEFRKHKCSKCPLRFNEKETLEIHTKCHSSVPEDKRYTCYVCDFVHSQWIKMYNHLFTHGIEKPCKCSQCSFSCLNKSDLAAHMFVHSTTKEWRCPKCNRSFKHRRNMMAHDRSCLGLDASGKPRKTEVPEECVCHICKKQLSTKRNLEKHYEIHMDVKPFVCSLCGHSTRLKESLAMHKRLHTGEKPFKCDQCEYSTPDKSSLRRHKRRHTNEKPYCCQFCDYKSIQKHCLDTHVRRKHTGEQFLCGLCHYTTFDRYGLNQHFKAHQLISSTESNGAETCMVNVSSVLSDNQRSKATGSKNIFVRVPEPMIDGSPADRKSESETTSSSKSSEEGIPTSTVSSIQSVSSSPTIEIGCAEGSLLQQIQQPGDSVYIQENGNILIKKADGRLLIIQQQEETMDGETSTISYS